MNDGGTTIALIVIVGLIVFLYFRRGMSRRITAPTLGILDLSEGSLTPLIQADSAKLGSLFNSVSESKLNAPKCDVLLLYCYIESDGNIRDSTKGLNEIIREAGASVAIVASDNDAKNYIVAAKGKNFGSVNIVLILDRRGEMFGEFFLNLFTAMKQGTSMPVAWNKLAPQIPRRDHPDCPASICLMRAGQITFGS
ncbi:MAG TPA: hypothetical protein VGH16_06215 [Candidatus Binatia bacterium]